MATLVINATSCVGEGEGSSFKVRNERRNSCHLHMVARGGDGVIDKGELALDLGKLVGKASTVIVVAVVVLHLCDGVPVVKVRDCLS